MALNISGWAVRNPVPPLVLFAVLTVIGLFAFHWLPITRAPNVDVPVVSVTVTEPGAAPTELETQVTKRIEDAIANVSGVKHVQSTVTDGVSSTVVELRLEVSSDRALNDVKDAVAKIRADLPRGIEEPIIERIDVVGQSIQTYAATAPGMTLEQLSWFVDDTVLRDLQGVPGVGRADRIGGATREIRVALDPDRLAALGITAGAVSGQLRDTNVDLAGGRSEVGGQEQAIRTLAQAGSRRGAARRPDRAARRPRGAARRPRRGKRHRGGAARLRPARWRHAGRRLRDLPRQGRQRRGRGSTRGRARRGAAPGPPRRGIHPHRRQRARDPRQLSLGDGVPDGGRGARRARGAPLPARLAGDLARGRGPAALHHPGLLRHGRARVLPQLREPARHHARRRHPGGRRYRRDREHRPPHPHGQAALDRAPSRRPTRSASRSSRSR